MANIRWKYLVPTIIWTELQLKIIEIVIEYKFLFIVDKLIIIPIMKKITTKFKKNIINALTRQKLLP